jgi:Rps23 Pro-64 3,4-dihydroxylase Tpa1-like proline 4-hydroxylase
MALFYIKQKNQKSSSLFSAPAKFRKFTSGPGIDIFVVQDFLPVSLAERWRDTMRHEWDKHSIDSGSSAWRYATNNDGNDVRFDRPNNQKTRSLERIQERNASAHALLNHNQFAYSKWELLPSHELVQEMERTFLSKEMIERVQSILGAQANIQTEQLSDLFVTYYGTSDFLNTHNDGVAGTYAFVVSLMDGPRDPTTNATLPWKPEFGGQTRYESPYEVREARQRQIAQQVRSYKYEWAESIFPAFNTALLFRTRPVGPQHDVFPVSYEAEAAGFYRFGLTGWYLGRDDVMDDMARAERDKMRGRD